MAPRSDRALLDTTHASDAIECGFDGPTDPETGGFLLTFEPGELPSVKLSSYGQEIEIVGIQAIRAVFGADSYVTKHAERAAQVARAA